MEYIAHKYVNIDIMDENFNTIPKLIAFDRFDSDAMSHVTEPLLLRFVYIMTL